MSNDKNKVRCCTDNDVGISYCDKKNNLGNSKSVDEYGNATFLDAQKFCSLNNRRLCTVDELKTRRGLNNTGVKGTGCGHDFQPTWTISGTTVTGGGKGNDLSTRDLDFPWRDCSNLSSDSFRSESTHECTLKPSGFESCDAARDSGLHSFTAEHCNL